MINPISKVTENYAKIKEHEKHMNNYNIEAKIRQQLQILRDKGFIEFSGRGHYKKQIIFFDNELKINK